MIKTRSYFDVYGDNYDFVVDYLCHLDNLKLYQWQKMGVVYAASGSFKNNFATILSSAIKNDKTFDMQRIVQNVIQDVRSIAERNNAPSEAVKAAIWGGISVVLYGKISQKDFERMSSFMRSVDIFLLEGEMSA